MKFKHIIYLAIGLSFLTCTNKEVEKSSSDSEVLFYANNVDNTATRTVLQEDGSIYWSPGDRIDVYIGDTYHYRTFISTNKQTSATAEFKGNFNGIDWPEEPVEYSAVYPSGAASSHSGNTFVISLNDTQAASAGTFDKFVSIARTYDNSFQFHNVFGGIKFKLDRENVSKVTFKGNNGEAICGKVKVSFGDSDIPVLKEVTESLQEINLVAPWGGTFSKDTWYYIVAFPLTLENGFTLVFTDKDGCVAEKVVNSPRTIKRSTWGRLSLADGGIEYELPDNMLMYTTNDEDIVETSLKDSEGNGPVSNKYSDGKGIMVFNAALPETLAAEAFKDVHNLATITLPGKITAIGDYAFYDSGLIEVSLAEGVTKIGKNAFSYCTKLEKVALPESLTAMDRAAFSYCSALKDINLPDGLTAIPVYCFVGCTSLEEIVFPDGLLTIQGNAFQDSGLTSLRLPNGIRGIGAAAFSHTQVVDVMYPTGISYVSERAFAGCEKLNYITIPSTVTEIGASAFIDCPLLTDVEMPGVKTIGKEAFKDCPSIHAVELPESITSIGDQAWYECTGLMQVYVKAVAPPTLGADVFYCTNECPIFVPLQVYVDNYKKATNWSVYAHRIHSFSDANSDFVDLGLSVLWAKRNVGAKKETDFGQYFAWGETADKESYTIDTYKWASTVYGQNKLTKYNSNQDRGTVDNLLQLELDDDAAYKSNPNMRMPTAAEWQELIDNSIIYYTTVDGVRGIQVESTVPGFSNRSIFIPAARSKQNSTYEAMEGAGMYWALTKLDDANYYRAQDFVFNANENQQVCKVANEIRYCGLTIRPVKYETQQSTGSHEGTEFEPWE